MTQTLEIREVQIRAVDAEQRTVTGLAVPYDTATDVFGYTEIVARGAVQDSDNAKLYWRHNEPIGKITANRETDAGWEITAKISETERGDEAYTLLKDGVVDKFSIGFLPVEHAFNEETNTMTRTKIKVQEVSLVPFPAYEGAQVSQVREASNDKEDPMSDVVTKADLTEVRESIEVLERDLKLASQPQAPTEARDVFSSVGDMVKRVAAGEDLAVRAYNGAVSGDTVLKDGWIGDLTQIIKKRRPIFETFSKGPLPDQGMSVEFAELKTDTTQAGVQATEGTDLLYGKVSITTKNAPVKTIGGWSSLSRQAIERSNIGILDTTWEALVEKYAQASEAYARGILNAAITDATATKLAEVEGTLTTQDGIVAAVLDLAEHFEDTGRSLDGVFVDKATFLALYGVAATDRVLQVAGQPADKVGSLTVQTASGSVAGLNFKLLPGASAKTFLAYDQTALKTLESAGVPFRLQDENVVNLTKDFSVYGYIAAAIQKRNGLVKVVAGA